MWEFILYLCCNKGARIRGDLRPPKPGKYKVFGACLRERERRNKETHELRVRRDLYHTLTDTLSCFGGDVSLRQ